MEWRSICVILNFFITTVVQSLNVTKKENSMYSNKNFKTKKALKEAVENGPVPCHQPGPFGPAVTDGSHACEGPHYPKPHRWYATVEVKEGKIVEVTG